jgi:hypothetical protein
MKIKVWMGIAVASLLLMGGGLWQGGAIDATSVGQYTIFSVHEAEFVYTMENTEPSEPMGILVSNKVANTEPPEPMAPSKSG